MVSVNKALLSLSLLAGAIGGAIFWLRASAPITAPTRPADALVRTEPPRAAFPATTLASVPAFPASADRLAEEITGNLRHGPAVERERTFNQLLPRLVAADPAAAGHLALAWPAGAERDELLRQVIRRWAEADVGGAITWLTSLLDADDRALAATAATAQVAQTDRAGALELAQALHVGLDDGTLEHMAQIWTEEEPAAAVNWVAAQPAGPVRDRLLARIAWVRAQSDPVEAAGLVLQHMAPSDTRDAALTSVVRQWAGRDPAAATAWMGHYTARLLR